MHKRLARPAIALLLTVSLAFPGAVRAQEERAAMDYEACMDAADEQFERCLEFAERTEELCWARYGYAKLGCTLKYGWDSWFRRKD